MIELTAEQSLVVANAASALCPSDRDAFHQAVFRQLNGHLIGDGAVGRAVAIAFSAYWRPPDFAVTRATSRWSRAAPNFDQPSKR